ncbi:MAG TPA: hypothetical protein VLB29_00405 [Nocardioidaceae bacterium]|nr:hypothetical protein [Nocardioidaceae bacterium]
MSLDQVRAVADAVLYEGYLLYPYRATARKNQARWQFGVLGPPGAAERGAGEEPEMAVQCLLAAAGDSDNPAGYSLRIHVRFLQLQVRTVERYDDRGERFVPVDVLTAGGEQWLSWDEAVEQEVVLDCSADDLREGVSHDSVVEGHEEVEEIPSAGGRIVRRRWPMQARVTATATQDGELVRLEVRVANVSGERPTDPDSGSPEAAIRTSLIGTHLILVAEGARFLSVVDPPLPAAAASRRCTQHRCWPVLAGPRPETSGSAEEGDQERASSAVVLASPIILYDFPEVAEESAGALFDATEIDEILTLRVMTMTDEEKAEARATDPRAREIIDRCDNLPASALQELHGIWRNPHADPSADPHGARDVREVEPPTFGEPEVPWWDPAADEAVRPELDVVTIDGVPVSKGSLVRVHPSRRADAQDLFFADQVARVTAVLSDVDGGVHVALVLADDPGADLHDWYGRYWYFAPDELEPLTGHDAEPTSPEHRSSSH